MREALERWLGEQLGEPVAVETITRMSTGHSRGMYRLDLASGARLVMRCEQGGVFGTSGAEEYRVMGALAQQGFPVARVRWSEPSGDVTGQPFFVMDFVDGDSQGREDRGLDRRVAADLVRTLRSLHRLDAEAVAGAFDTFPEPERATEVQIDRWLEVYRAASLQPIALLEEAATWLHDRVPALDRISVVHGDPGPGNLVHRDGAVVALTDWEFSHLGDATEDWAYLALMRGSRTMPLAEWLNLFADVGVVVDEGQLRYWGAFNLFKGACANRTALEVFRAATPSPNLAIIGTALHQTFLRRLSQLVAGA